MALTLQVRIGVKNHGIENNFMQDGVLHHIYNPVEQLLAKTFGICIISWHFPNIWPPPSSDINLADFWFWHYLKKRAYLNKSTTIEELENSIQSKSKVFK
ncbi:hypothetical protein ILUMI_14136 [Ignelater luminosus]|uniref:Uncharacterized protein n=1 Tax=Ignelater luminosus TaxID=2038154 RepID=A0A8K0CVD5_IGNLU|nr:hypothetical protein ILUMI_14136 [Ignelater luminosus]